MWFKQLSIYRLSGVKIKPEELMENLAELSFQPCLPSLAGSSGWVPPLEEDEAPFLFSIGSYHMFCLQFAEKILPATIVRQTLDEQVKEIEKKEARKVYQKEKQRLKDEITLTLLPRAFTRLSKMHAYIDSKEKLLIIHSTSANKIESFMSLFKRTIDGVKAKPVKLASLGKTLSQWILTSKYPKSFAIEKAALLQDLNHQQRVIRCQEENLTSKGMQFHLKDGFTVKQLAMTWQDRVSFLLADDFTFRSIKYDDQLVSAAKDELAETAEELFKANFFIMTETLSKMLDDFLETFVEAEIIEKKGKAAVTA